MRWVSKNKEIKIRFGFLIFPKTINNETRWLEFVKWKRVLKKSGPKYPNGELMYASTYYWINEKWLNEGEK